MGRGLSRRGLQLNEHKITLLTCQAEENIFFREFIVQEAGEISLFLDSVSPKSHPENGDRFLDAKSVLHFQNHQ
jgi:hypothetical protein